jgi:hypothetical protein
VGFVPDTKLFTSTAFLRFLMDFGQICRKMTYLRRRKSNIRRTKSTKTMKKPGILLSMGIVLACAAASLSFGDEKVSIYHTTGNGSYSVLTISANAVAGHANHEGDRWFRTQCPLSGPEDCNP